MDPLKYVEFAKSIARVAGKNQKTVIVAVSFGAMIAYLWALNYPQEVEAIVLINTSLAPTAPHIRIRPTGLLKLIKIIRNKDTKTRERDILKLTTHLLGSKLDKLSESWGEHANHFHTSRANTLKQLIAASRVNRKSGRPEVPTLILCSDKDELVNPRSSHEIAKDWVPL